MLFGYPPEHEECGFGPLLIQYLEHAVQVSLDPGLESGPLLRFHGGFEGRDVEVLLDINGKDIQHGGQAVDWRLAGRLRLIHLGIDLKLILEGRAVHRTIPAEEPFRSPVALYNEPARWLLNFTVCPVALRWHLAGQTRML